MFPLRSKSKKSILTEIAKLNLNKTVLEDCPNIVYNNISKQYQKTFGVNFENILVEIQNKLQKKVTQDQKKQWKINKARTFVRNMEKLLTVSVFRKLNYNSIKQYKFYNFHNKIKAQVLQLLLCLERNTNIKSNLKSTSLLQVQFSNTFFPYLILSFHQKVFTLIVQINSRWFCII